MKSDYPNLHFPRISTYFTFVSGDVVWQVCGLCQVIRAECRPNAVGRMGGRVWFRTRDSEEASVTLSYYHQHAREQIVPPQDMEGAGHGG